MLRYECNPDLIPRKTRLGKIAVTIFVQLKTPIEKRKNEEN